MNSRLNKLYIADSDDVETLRALCRYETHGGYKWYGVTDDSALLCVPCMRDNYRQVFRATSDPADHSGGAIRGYTNSGEIESPDFCAHCNKPIGSDHT